MNFGFLFKAGVRNRSRLVQKHVMDKRGRMTTVWVKPGELIRPAKGETHAITDPQDIKKYIFKNRDAKKLVRSVKRKMLSSTMRVIEKKYPNFKDMPLNKKLALKAHIKKNVNDYVDNAALNIASQNQEWMKSTLGNLKNKRTRKMFRALTGISLGASARSTKKGIERYISEGIRFQHDPSAKTPKPRQITGTLAIRNDLLKRKIPRGEVSAIMDKIKSGDRAGAEREIRKYVSAPAAASILGKKIAPDPIAAAREARTAEFMKPAAGR
ncbi:MAG TPA: hypothetical protein PKM65_20270 [Spirochaetota bacterium]|nr:hypothetical protein [Spirochaetota bacterium]